jgi:hypothetical protein
MLRDVYVVGIIVRGFHGKERIARMFYKTRGVLEGVFREIR